MISEGGEGKQINVGFLEDRWRGGFVENHVCDVLDKKYFEVMRDFAGFECRMIDGKGWFGEGEHVRATKNV